MDTASASERTNQILPGVYCTLTGRPPDSPPSSLANGSLLINDARAASFLKSAKRPPVIVTVRFRG
jgi:hypothetical protein